MKLLRISILKYSLILCPLLIIAAWKLHDIHRGALAQFWRSGYPLIYPTPPSKTRDGNEINQNTSTEGHLVSNSVRVESQEVNISTETKKIYTTPTIRVQMEEMANCSAKGENLVGELYVDKSLINEIQELHKAFSLAYGGWVEKGGAWKPRHCRAIRKVAIIIPYRNRYEQLKIFLRHMHPILKRQLLDYRIFTVEQEGDTVFNRAILFNIGFKESLKFDNYECFIFHDVDLLPENDKNVYNCHGSPRHMCPAVDKFSYRLLYEKLFGGVEAFLKKDFELVNGFSNKFWGWGGEDDDLYNRVLAKSLRRTRPAMTIGRYKMIQIHHHVDERNDAKRTWNLLQESANRMKVDGLNTLKYKLVDTVNHLLFTSLHVEVDPETV